MYNTIEEVEKCYCFPDSSLFYISNYYYNENTNNIELLGDSIFEYRFRRRDWSRAINAALGIEYYSVLPDTFELSGMNADSLCWRDILIDDISIGYVNVRPELKEKYDQCLDTFNVKKKKKSKFRKAVRHLEWEYDINLDWIIDIIDWMNTILNMKRP